MWGSLSNVGANFETKRINFVAFCPRHRAGVETRERGTPDIEDY